MYTLILSTDRGQITGGSHSAALTGDYFRIGIDDPRVGFQLSLDINGASYNTNTLELVVPFNQMISVVRNDAQTEGTTDWQLIKND